MENFARNCASPGQGNQRPYRGGEERLDARQVGGHVRFAQDVEDIFALVHGDLEKDSGTINAAISRDQIRRTRMTTKRDEGGRSAISHYQVLKRFSGRYRKFTLVAVKIETGRTHQIRVHMSSIGHPVVGDTLYGAPARIVVPVAISGKRKTQQQPEGISLGRNFLHSAELEFPHPRSGKVLTLKSPLPDELKVFLRTLDAAAEAKSRAIRA